MKRKHLTSITYDGHTYEIGKPARSRKFAYVGNVTAIYPPHCNEPKTRVWIKREGDHHGRIVPVEDLEVAS